MPLLSHISTLFAANLQLLFLVPYKPTAAIKNKLFWNDGRSFGCFDLNPIIPPFQYSSWVAGSARIGLKG